MSRRDEIKKLITKHNRRLQILREQQALKGRTVAPEILIEIQDLEANIETLQAELKAIEQDVATESTQPSRPDDIQRLITNYNRRLRKLKEQHAVMGSTVDPQTRIEIEDLEAKVEELQSVLKAMKDSITANVATIEPRQSLNQDEIRKLISNYQRRLHKLHEQKALRGIEVDPSILLEIEDVEAEIAQLQAQLRELDEARSISYKDPAIQKYNISAIRRLLTEVFNDKELTVFCYEYFPAVHNNFASEMSFQKKVQLLIEYADRNNSFDELLSLVRVSNLDKFAEFAPLLQQTTQQEEVDTSPFIARPAIWVRDHPIVALTIISLLSLLLSVINLVLTSDLTEKLPQNVTSIVGSIFWAIVLLIVGMLAFSYRKSIFSTLKAMPSGFSSMLEQSRGLIEQGKQKRWFKWENDINEKLLVQKHVYLHELDSIPKSQRQAVVESFIKNTTDYDLIYDPEKACLMYRFWPKFQASTSAWEALTSHLNSDMDVFEEQLVAFTHVIENALGSGNVSVTKAPSRFNRFVGCKINVGNTFDGLNLPRELLVCVSQYTEPALDELEDAYHLVKGQQQVSIALLLLFSDDNHAQQIQLGLDQRFRQSKACDIIVANHSDVTRWITSENPQDELRKDILNHISLKAISPFVITGPTPPNMFFGREKELRQIRDHLSNKSFAIIGGRRVGKTSIALRLFNDYLPKTNFYTIYQDVSIISSYEEFLAISVLDWQPIPPPETPATIGHLLAAIPLDRPVALLLDEADKLVTIDRNLGWPIFNQLRAIVNSGYLRVILIGERTLREEIQNSESPLFNFADDVLIGRLDFDNVANLITQPMEKMDIIYDSRIVKRIYEFTSGHPNIVQRLCHQLIEVLNNRNDKILTFDDIGTVVSSPGFQKNDFLNTYLSQATLLERILVILLTKVDQRPYSAAKIRQLLAERLELNPRVREVDLALQRLVDLRSILNDTPSGYTFAVSAIPLVINRPDTIAAEDLLEQYVEDYQDYGDVTLEEIEVLERT